MTRAVPGEADPEEAAPAGFDPEKAEPAVPYHHLARWAAPGWWRSVVGTVLILVAAFFAGIVLYGVAMVGAEIAGRPHDDADLPILPPLVDNALAFASIAVALPIVLVTARLLHRRPAGTLSSVQGRLRWGWLGWCLLLALGAVVVMFALSIALAPFEDVFSTSAEQPGADDGAWVGAGEFLLGFLVLAALVPFQAAAEEYVFRGWLLQAVGAWARSPWPAILVQAVLFAALHGWGTLWGFVDLVIWASVMGWLTIRTGGLEASIALHTLNNLFAAGWSVAFGILSLDVTAADMSLLLLLIDIPVMAGYAALIVWLSRRRRLVTTASLARGVA